jgi:hypothetical protein
MKTTTDIYFAAAMLSLGAKLEKVDRTDPRHMVFHLSSPEVKVNPATDKSFATVVMPLQPALDLDALELDWANGKVPGNLFDMAESIKRMKSVVHSSNR